MSADNGIAVRRPPAADVEPQEVEALIAGDDPRLEAKTSGRQPRGEPRSETAVSLGRARARLARIDRGCGKPGLPGRSEPARECLDAQRSGCGLSTPPFVLDGVQRYALPTPVRRLRGQQTSYPLLRDLA